MNSTPSLRTPPSLCERSEAIHLADHTVPNHGLPRPTASQRRISVDCRVATLLAETETRLCEPSPRYWPSRLCERHPVFASAAKQSTSQTARCSTIDCHGLQPRRDEKPVLTITKNSLTHHTQTSHGYKPYPAHQSNLHSNG